MCERERKGGRGDNGKERRKGSRSSFSHAKKDGTGDIGRERSFLLLREKKQELLFSRERARAKRSSGETLRTACCIFRAAQRRAVAFQSTRARRLRSGRFGNITVQIHGTYSCNHLEKERDACSVPTQPLAVTMPVETDKNVVAAFFFWFCAARSRASCLYFQR